MKPSLLQIFTVIACLLFSLNLIAQPCNIPFPPGTGSDGCLNAPLFCSLTDLNGYCSSTTNTPPGVCPPQFCGTCENVQWIAFMAPSETVSFLIIPSNCIGGNGGGLQAHMYQTSDCSNLTAISDCFPGGIGVLNPIVITNYPPLIIGEIYYLMIDGYAGANCEYYLEVLQGGGDAPTPVADSILGSQNPCIDELNTYSILSAFATTQYDWSIEPEIGAIISGQGTQSIEVEWSDQGVTQLCVIPSNACEVGESVCVTISIEEQVLTPVELQEVICAPDCYTLGDIDYCEAGTYTAIFINQNGCDSLVVELDLTVIEAPQTAPVLEGSSIGCEGATTTYYAPPSGSEFVYNWNVTGGTYVNYGDSIEVNWTIGASEGEICISSSNDCGVSPEDCLEVLIEKVPPQPAIVEEIDQAADWLRSYTVPAVMSTTNYQWSVPADAEILNGQGTESIIVYWYGSSGGEVCVVAQNSCGVSDETCMSVLITSTYQQRIGTSTKATIFPNPMTEVLYLKVAEPFNFPTTILFYDTAGKLVHTSQIPEGTKQQAIQLNKLPPGPYFWVLSVQNERLAGGKIVME